MRRKEGKEEGHFLLLWHSKFSQNYGMKQQPFYYAYNRVGQEFERELGKLCLPLRDKVHKPEFGGEISGRAQVTALFKPVGLQNTLLSY